VDDHEATLDRVVGRFGPDRFGGSRFGRGGLLTIFVARLTSDEQADARTLVDPRIAVLASCRYAESQIDAEVGRLEKNTEGLGEVVNAIALVGGADCPIVIHVDRPLSDEELAALGAGVDAAIFTVELSPGLGAHAQ